MPNTKTVELLLPHRHGGNDYQAGETIEVSENDATYLIGRDIAKEATAVAAKKPDLKGAKDE